MYYTHPQRTLVSSAAKSRLHTSATTYRKFTARFIVLLVLMLILVSVGAIVQAHAGGASSATEVVTVKGAAQSPIVTTVKIIVEQGDSLWTIAGEHAPKGTDVRSYIDQIKKVNQLKGSTLKEGQVLLLP